MRCTACDHSNPSDARFCNRCGAELELRCAHCDRVNPPESRFCNGCGRSLEGPAPVEPAAASDLSDAVDPRSYTPRHLAEKILRQKAALEGERKHVTVLFADLVDSTELAVAIDAERMHALMDRAFAKILEQVHRYEGTVNQFTGDGVMALFGAPIALEDAPRRAIVAALGIQRELEALDREVQQLHGRGFRMRIGIHCGPVVVGRIGDDLRMDYTAVGDTTNLASRLEGLAEPGEVVISEATSRMVEGFFDLSKLEPTHVKGVAAPIQAFRVVAERGYTGRIEALSEADLTSYVGRESELEMLMSAMSSARDKHGRVAFLVGDAGIGKSRLLYEFRKRLADVPHTWFEGRCASYARATPFHAIADGLRRRIGLDDRDDDATVRAKVDAMEAESGGDLEWTLPYLRALLSLPSGDAEVDAMDAMTRRSESCRAMLARISRIAEQKPVVLVIEDLHWVDTASEEFLGFLAESIPTASILMILTHRPGYQQPFGDRSYHVRIPLQALSDDATNAIVASVLHTDQLPSGLQNLISAKAEGNPLFIEEVLRSLVEEGVITFESGRPKLSRDLSAVSVPDRIQDVLMARLDRLEEGPKRAIQIASVIGREFALRLLERISEAGDGIEEIVGELRALELIYEKSSHPELAFMFKHALTHDVAYDSVLVARRRVLHRIVGTAIEELYRDRLAEHYEALAHHFNEAEQWARALHYLELASEKCEAAYANHAAIDHCRAALALADRLGEEVSDERRLALSARLASVSWSISDFGTSASAYERSAALSDQPSQTALNLARASFSHLWNHDYERSEKAVSDSLELAREHGADAATAFALMSRDECELVHGRALIDEQHIAPIRELAERSGDASVMIQCFAHLAQRAEWRGDYRRAIALSEHGVAIASRVRAPDDAVFGVWFMGIALISLGDYARGLSVLGDGLEVCDRIGNRAVKARLLNTLGWAHAEFGAHQQAARYNRLGTDLAREMVELGLVPGAPELYANAAINLAGNQIALGDIDAAAEQLAPIEANLDHDDDPWMRWRYSLHVFHAQARIALARGEAERALAITEREVEGARATAARKIEARGLELRGRVLVVLDRRDEAEAILRAARAVAQDIEYPPVLWRTLAMNAELDRRRGDRSAAQSKFDQARAIIDDRARLLDDSILRNEFCALGERLSTDPIEAFR